MNEESVLDKKLFSRPDYLHNLDILLSKSPLSLHKNSLCAEQYLIDKKGAGESLPSIFLYM